MVVSNSATVPGRESLAPSYRLCDLGQVTSLCLCAQIEFIHIKCLGHCSVNTKHAVSVNDNDFVVTSHQPGLALLVRTGVGIRIWAIMEAQNLCGFG